MLTDDELWAVNRLVNAALGFAHPTIIERLGDLPDLLIRESGERQFGDREAPTSGADGERDA